MFDDWFASAETVRKRDNYDTLHDILKDALKEHDKKVAEATDAYNSYIKAVPNLSNSKIPSNDFDPKREELNEKLNQYFDKEKDMRSALVIAIDKAYERYLHYKNLAAKEAKAKKEKLEKEFEELKEGLERWISG
ncbi:chorismate synthase [Fictibacillus gelatini]|uniref:chorismate synthase n=1 Tax=Fictibacillus gelatini TaxID=225985 RepID=UPI000415F6DE|nr:chorismate synthase [Fictibacillus gelatini]